MSGLLIPNTFDPKGKTPTLFANSTGSTTFVDLLSITGSGYLIGVDAKGGSSAGGLNIIVDGNDKTDFNMPPMNYICSLSITFLIRFESSLKVQGKISGNTLYVNGVYLLD